MHIDSYKVLFWDFDGVIKDSINVKTQAYVKLFEVYGIEIVEKVKNHHLANGGMSRFEKFPIYAAWVGKKLNKEQINEYSKKFSSIALQGVIDSAWVPGVKDYLLKNRHTQTFVLISATPQDELISILDTLQLKDCFSMVYGSPVSKRDAIAKAISSLGVLPSNCLMIGDARADLEGAQANGISFLLRRHHLNESVFAQYTGPSIKDFLEL